MNYLSMNILNIAYIFKELFIIQNPCLQKSFNLREPEQIISVCYTLCYVIKWLLMPFICLRDTITLFDYWIYKKMLYFLNHVSWSSKISVCSVKISVCSGNFSVWYTFSGKISVCSRFSRELGSPGSGFLEACIYTPCSQLLCK